MFKTSEMSDWKKAIKADLREGRMDAKDDLVHARQLMKTSL